MGRGDSAVKITRKSPFSGEVHQMDLPITVEQINRWEDGELVQRVFPTSAPIKGNLS